VAQSLAAQVVRVIDVVQADDVGSTATWPQASDAAILAFHDPSRCTGTGDVASPLGVAPRVPAATRAAPDCLGEGGPRVVRRSGRRQAASARRRGDRAQHHHAGVVEQGQPRAASSASSAPAG
jgi:hypothetical protein